MTIAPVISAASAVASNVLSSHALGGAFGKHAQQPPSQTASGASGGQSASSGQTTSVVQNADGTETITVTNSAGQVVSSSVVPGAGQAASADGSFSGILSGLA